MVKTIILIIISFFAVIGFLECLLSLLENISTSGDDQPDEIAIVAGLSGEIDNVPFMLNTMIMQAERINYKNCVTKVMIVDNGLSENTYCRVKHFCDLNDNIFMEKRNNM